MELSRELYRAQRTFLEERDPTFVREVIEGAEVRLDAELLETRRGEVTLKLAGTLLHSTVDPRKEAQRVALRSRERREGELRDATVLFGFGLGYYLEALLEEGSEPVIVVEPDPDLFVTALHARDLRPALSNPRTNLFLARRPESVIELLNLLEVRYPVIVAPGALRSVEQEYYREVEETLAAFRQRNEVNANTLTRFGKLWVRNLLVNLRRLASSPGLGILERRFSGIPALLLAAGPTLDDLAHLLPELQQRCLLVAVDTALPYLQRHNLQPDISVVVDPQYWNTRHLDAVELKTGVAVVEPSTHPRVFRHLEVPVLFGGSLFPLGTFVEAMLPNRLRLGAGGSVATSAWDAARIAGAQEIHTIGLDLGFPQLRTHAAGSFFEERGHILSRRLAGIEDYTYRYLRGGEPFIAEATSGAQLLSDRRMQLYKWWFESQGRLNPEVTTYTLSQNSLAIDGRAYKPPQELLTLPPRRVEIDRALAEIRDEARTVEAEARSRYGRLRSATGELRGEIARIEETARRGIRICRELETRLAREGDLSGAELSRLDAVDKAIAGAPNREVLGFLMQEVDRESRRQSRATDRRGQLEDTLRRSRSIYSTLSEAAGYHESLFAKLLD